MIMGSSDANTNMPIKSVSADFSIKIFDSNTKY